MPELPEVETIRRYLIKNISNLKILKVDILDNVIVRNSKWNLSNLVNETIIDIKRIGKYLLFYFNKYIMISHLRMEGKYYLYQEDENNSQHARIIFHLSNKEKLIYDDVRRFGLMELYKIEEYSREKCLKNVNLEPFEYNCDDFYKIISSKNLEIKALLLDQSIISGIGNIYADEILFKSKISPFQKGNTLTKNQTDLILTNAIDILNKAISLNGSTIRTYHPSRNANGSFQNELLVYDQKGKKCKICNTLLIKRTLHGRGTTYCPNCQHVAKVIGVYGKIAAGKSTLCSYFQNKGYPTFSADKEVDNIYKNDLIFTLKCVDVFHEECLNQYNKVNKEYIKQIVIKDPEKKKTLENIIFPLVLNRMLKFIKDNINQKLVILEVPLLFEAGFDKYVDYIIGLDASLDSQIRNLKNRKSKNIAQDLLLNSNNKFDQNIQKCNFIIHNNSTIEDFNKSLNELENTLLSI